MNRYTQNLPIYVDDVSLGADTVESTFDLYLKSKMRLADAGFTLRMFICAQVQPSDVHAVDLSYAKSSHPKEEGQVEWNSQSIFREV